MDRGASQTELPRSREIAGIGQPKPAGHACGSTHDFVRLGFNRAAAGGRAVDGIESLVAGASGGFTNYRFAQPGRTMRQHIGRWYPERQFPFANQVITDPVTGQTNGVLKPCTLSDTCPMMFEINSETAPPPVTSSTSATNSVRAS